MFRRQSNNRYNPRSRYRQERPPAPAPVRRKRRRGLSRLLGEFASWFSFLLLISGAVVGGVFYLLHTRFDDIVRRHVEARFRLAYPQHLVTLESARRLEGEGIELRGLRISETGAEGAWTPVFQADELLLQCQAGLEDLVGGKLSPKQLIIRRLKLHARQNTDGTWNLARLLPLPRFGSQPVPIVVEDSSGEIQRGTGEGAIAVMIPRCCVTPPGSAVASDTGTTASSVWSVDGLLSSTFVQQLAVRGAYDPATHVWQATGDVRRLALNSRELLGCLPSECVEFARMGDDLDLAVNARFEATNQEASGSWCRLNIDGDVEGRIEDRRLPVPLTDVKGKFRSDGRSLEFSELSARAGTALVTAECRIGGFFEDAPCSLRLSAQRFPVDRQLVQLLPEQWRAIGDKIAPQGLVDAELGLSFDGRTVKHEADITCHGVSFAYHKFPYRLSNGTGKLIWSNGQLKFQDFVAYANETPVVIEGEIENPGPDYSGFVRVTADKPLRIDERLIAALPESARRIVSQLQPQGGFVTATARFERHGTAPPVATRYIRLSLQDCAISYTLFPYPLTKIRGDIVMQDDRWTIEGLEGVNDSARVLCTGGWGPDENGVVQLALNFNADDVPLEDELRGALRPEAQAVWQSLQPRGTVDEVKATITYDHAVRKTAVQVTANKRPPQGNVAGRTISIKPTWLPYQFDEVEGTLNFRDGVTRFSGIRGHHGDAVLILNGEAATTPQGTWRVKADNLEVDRLEITRELVAALPRRLGGALSRLNIAGPVNLNGSLLLEGEKGSTSPVSSEWDLDFDVAGASLNCGLCLDRIHGGLKLAGVNNERGLSSRGWLNVDSLLYQGIQCTNVQGPISLDDERLGFGEWVTRDDQEARPANISARVFGGELRANGEVVLSGDFPFQLETGLFQADLATISREATSRRLEVSGETRVNLQLAGNSKGKHTWHGAGTAQLTNADIYKLPVMVDMLKLLRIKPPDGTAFTSSDARYRIEGDRIYFDEIAFNGDVIRLDGKGDMTLDRALNLTFHTSLASNHISDRLFQPFLKEVGKQVFEIRVTGTVDNPLVNKEALRNIRENIESIFPGAQPAGSPVMSRLPLPTESAGGTAPQR